MRDAKNIVIQKCLLEKNLQTLIQTFFKVTHWVLELISWDF